MKYLIPALLILALLAGFEGVTVRKDLVAERQTIDNDWTSVNAALESRAAIIPDLTQAVETELPPNAPGESTAIVSINDARKVLHEAPSQHEKILANSRIDESLARLMLLIENYPKLDSSKRYGELLEAIKNADYQIALARRKYNEAVEHYNARIEVFPNNVVASVSRFGKVEAYFQTPAL